MDALLHRDPVAPPLVHGRWQVRLLGAVEARRPDGRDVRAFPTRPVAALLARLALAPQRTHAREACGDFEARGADLAAIDDAMRRLDGLPLAIELAASRLRGLGLGELLQQWRQGSSLDLLTRSLPAPDAHGRHGSMRGVLQWSWSLLSPAQRHLMQAPAIFRAPALPDAVAHVAGQPVGPLRTSLEGLKGLSMVRSQADCRGRHRWALLQPVREFVAEQALPHEARAARARLCDWLIRWARSPDAAVADSERQQAVAAIEAATGDGATQQAIELALALRGHWELRPMPLANQLALEPALQSLGTAAPAWLRAQAHDLLSMLRGLSGLPADALRHAQIALDLAADPRSRCLALACWALAACFEGRRDLDYDGDSGQPVGRTWAHRRRPALAGRRAALHAGRR